jgi:ACT domain-containing protein
MIIQKHLVHTKVDSSRKKIKACSQTFIKSISTEMHAIYTFSNINIGVSDDGKRDFVKHVKTVKENAC